MKSGCYRSGQAAKLWGTSTHLVRRLCEAGLIRAERTASGQWKIPYSEVERIKTEGMPEIPSSMADDDRQQREENKTSSMTNLETFQSHGLLALPSGFATVESDFERPSIEKGDEFQSRWQDSQIGETRAQSRPSAVSQTTLRVRTDQERIDWHDSWTATALRSIPREAPPEVALSVRETVSDVLENLGPEHSWWVVDPLVSAAVTKALRPWNQEQETARAITMSCDLLPPGAKDLFSPTPWQSRACEASTAAIRKLPASAAFAEKLSAGRAVVLRITSEFEDEALRKRIVSLAYLSDVIPEQHENAREAIRRKLEGLSIGTHWLAMEKAREQALAPFRESKKRKERVDGALGRVRGYLERLHNAGETDFESTWAVWDFAKRLEGRLRSEVEQELLNDDLTDEELSELIEELVDEELE